MSKSKNTPLDKPLPRGRGEVNLSAFSFLFSELVQYSQSRTNQITLLERRLSDIGWSVGQRILDVVVYRERGLKRETKLFNILSFIQNYVWKTLFGKAADSIEQSLEHKDQFMIIDALPVTNKFISVPKEMGALNCAAFVAGVVKGVLDATNFNPEKVTAHTLQDSKNTVIVIKFPNDENLPFSLS